MDKDKKLEEFFRNRVNDFDAQDGDWDKPDFSAFQNAQQHFPKRPPQRIFNWSKVALIISSLIIAGLLGYIFYINQAKTEEQEELKVIKKELQIAKTDLLKNTEELKKLKDNISLEIIELKKHNNNQSHLIKSLTKENNSFQKAINIKNNQLNKLNFENKKLEDKVQELFVSHEKNSQSENTFNSNSLTNNDSKPLNIKNFESITFLPAFPVKHFDYKNEKLSVYAPFAHIIKPKVRKQRKDLEVGLSHISHFQRLPVDYEFEKLEEDEFDKKETYSSLSTKGYQINIAYPIKENLWITSGFRSRKGSLEQFSGAKLIYDKAGEYTNDQGKIFNQVEINTRSSLSDAGYAIDFEVPSVDGIEDGEFLYAEWGSFQDFSFTQIPIGINYFLGEKNLKLFFQGGLGWNNISFGEYSIEANIAYDDEALNIGKAEKKEDKGFSYQFINGFAGAGLDYEISTNWHIRVSYNLEKDFIQNEKFLNSSALNQVFQAGLNYRF